MVKDWILRIGDGKNFINSSKVNIWGISSKYKTFISSCEVGDRLWFVVSGGKIFALANFVSLKIRELGPLVSLTPTNEDLGWDNSGETCDVQIEFKNLLNLSKCELYSGIKNQTSVRLWNESYEINLPLEYHYIEKYCNISKGF